MINYCAGLSLAGGGDIDLAGKPALTNQSTGEASVFTSLRMNINTRSAAEFNDIP